MYILGKKYFFFWFCFTFIAYNCIVYLHSCKSVCYCCHITVCDKTCFVVFKTTTKTISNIVFLDSIKSECVVVIIDFMIKPAFSEKPLMFDSRQQQLSNTGFSKSVILLLFFFGTLYYHLH